MTSYTLKNVLHQLDEDRPRMGAIKKLGKAIKKDQALADELWAEGRFVPRMLALLIMDTKTLDQARIEALAGDINRHPEKERDHLSDWLLAQQLMKSKRTTALLESWSVNAHPLLRRLFWYHQARLRWTGQEPPDNTEALLAQIEDRLEHEDPQVQWAMNFAACQIGLFDLDRRARCIALGERLGLYRDQKVPANCTPNYLPEFIRIEAAKRA